MSKIISTKKINAGFLAIVLIVGTFVAISPSFMIGAHAQQYGMDQQKYNSYESDYGMDNSYDNKQSYGKDSNSYDKSKDSTIVKKEKCNNINVNLNGFNGIAVNAVPPVLNGLATNEAQASEDEGEIGTSSSGSGERNANGYQNNDKNFRSVCIDNNNVQVPEVVIPPEPEPETCDECFTTVLTEGQIESILNILQDQFPSIAAFCDILTDQQLLITEELFRGLLRAADIDLADQNSLIECLESVGVVFLQEPEP